MVRIVEVCDQNGDRVPKSNQSCHMCIMRPKRCLVKYEKYGTLSIYFVKKCHLRLSKLLSPTRQKKGKNIIGSSNFFYILKLTSGNPDATPSLYSQANLESYQEHKQM